MLQRILVQKLVELTHSHGDVQRIAKYVRTVDRILNILQYFGDVQRIGSRVTC